MNIFNLFDSAYRRLSEDGKAFGKHFCGPEEYPHGKEVLVACYSKAQENGDGQPTEVYEQRWPARFFTIKALPNKNSAGEDQAGFSLTTGSGGVQLERWVAQTAELISKGMIGMQKEE